MSKIVLPTVTNSANLSTLNSNFQAIANALNNQVLYRDNPDGEPNQLLTPVDTNGQAILNPVIVLPTSSMGLPSGAIYNNGGVIAIVP